MLQELDSDPGGEVVFIPSRVPPSGDDENIYHSCIMTDEEAMRPEEARAGCSACMSIASEYLSSCPADVLDLDIVRVPSNTADGYYVSHTPHP